MECIKAAIASAWQALRRWVKEQEANYQARAACERTHCEICGRSREDGVSICPTCNRCGDPKCNAGCIFCREVPARPATCPCCGQGLSH